MAALSLDRGYIPRVPGPHPYRHLWPETSCLRVAAFRLELAAVERRIAFDACRLPRRLLSRGPYVAEIIHDRRATPPIYHCVVQSIGSREILDWFQTLDRAEAEHEARACLDRLVLEQRRAA
jgi:hypothetical protein